MKIEGIKGYNNSETAVAGEGKKLPVGNYICKILGAKVEQSKAGRPMFIVQYDIASGEFINYYQNNFNAMKTSNSEAKYRGIFYQLMDGDSVKFYKGFLSSIEKSNNIKLDGENGFDSKLLIGKVFGGRFGEEEYEYNGEVKTITKLRFVISTESLEKQPILEAKKINKTSDNYYVTETSKSYCMVEEDEEDNLPF